MIWFKISVPPSVSNFTTWVTTLGIEVLVEEFDWVDLLVWLFEVFDWVFDAFDWVFDGFDCIGLLVWAEDWLSFCLLLLSSVLVKGLSIFF